MAFFDKKQEVIDVELTQFGKSLLSRGFFKPVFYQFFDDDILYNSEYAGFTESQNDTEDRILKNTPKLKTQHLTYPVQGRYEIETERILDGSRLRFTPLRRLVPPSIQERILLYPMCDKKPGDEAAPSFNVVVKEAKFKKITFSNLTGSGIQQNIPVIDLEPVYTLKEDRSSLAEPKVIDQEVYVDLFGREVNFADNSKLIVQGDKVILDVQEDETLKEYDSFTVNIYEVKNSTGEEIMIKLEDIEQINKYFHIKTNEHVEEIKNQDPKSRNYYNRGEE